MSGTAKASPGAMGAVMIGLVAASVTPVAAAEMGAPYGRPDPVVMFDGFESGNLLWSFALAPCYRPENVEIDQQETVRVGRWAAQLTVNPSPDDAMARFQAAPPSPSCLDPADPGSADVSDGTERAEMWEIADRRLPFGTDVWYGFSFWVGPEVKPDDGRRLVIGQIKQTGGSSPFVAQRFTDRNFHITIQQNGPDGGECRILVNYQHEPPPMPPSEEDSGDTVISPCAQDVTIERFAPLPNPFGRWVDMVYHVKASPEGHGILEVWGNGKLLSRVTGRYGYKADADAIQYFKFGPYRDKVPYSTTVWFDAFARGHSYEEVYLGGPFDFQRVSR